VAVPIQKLHPIKAEEVLRQTKAEVVVMYQPI
jgi:hypothetical protein